MVFSLNLDKLSYEPNCSYFQKGKYLPFSSYKLFSYTRILFPFKLPEVLSLSNYYTIINHRRAQCTLSGSKMETEILKLCVCVCYLNIS